MNRNVARRRPRGPGAMAPLPGPPGQMAGQPSLFNPERPQALVARYQRYLTSGRLAAIRVEYRAGGIQVVAAATQADADEGRFAPLPALLRRAEVVVDDNHRLAYARVRFENRFDLPAPEGFGGSGQEAHIATSVALLPFRWRKAYNMSNQEFDRAYPQGWVDGHPVPVPERAMPVHEDPVFLTGNPFRALGAEGAAQEAEEEEA